MVFSRKKASGIVWYISYREIPSGAWKQKKSGPDKKLAIAHEQKLAIEWQRFQVTGVWENPAMKKTSNEHVEDFLRFLEPNVSLHYLKMVETRLLLALAFMLAHPRRPTLAQLTGDDMVALLEALRSGHVGAQRQKRKDAKGLSAKTRDEYGRILKQFGEWMVDEYRLPRNPFRRFRRVMKRGRDETYVRRALSLDEVRRLAEVAGGGRAVLYYLAATTGLRVGELRALRWEDMRLLDPIPHIHLPAFRDGNRCTKNGKPAIIPLQVWVAEMIQLPLQHEWQEVRRKPVFRIQGKPAQMIRRDAVLAGVSTRDDQGRVLDFHSLRSSTFEILKELRVDNVAIKEVMRHAKYDTTLNHYHKEDLGRLASLITVIPDPRS